MKVKKEYFILGALIVALTAYLFLHSRDRTRYELPQWTPVSGADLSKIELLRQDASVTLFRDGEAWRLAPKGYPADRDRIQGMVETLQKLSLTALVSESESYDRYDLSEERKITVKAWAGDRIRLEIDVGKAAPSFQHTFVRLAGDPRVYHAKENFRDRFDQSLDNLRDKNVLKFETDDIREVELTKGGEKILLSRKDLPAAAKAEESAGKEPPSSPAKPVTVWETSDGRQAAQEKLDRLLSALSRLRCERYLEDKKKEDMVKPKHTIRVAGTQEHTLSIFAKAGQDEKGHPAVSSENAYVFLLPDWQAERLMLGPEDLIKTEAEKEDAKAPVRREGKKVPAPKKK